MSLKDKFKADSSLVRDGVWFDLEKNADGTRARVKLRRNGRGNPKWSTAFRAHTADRDMEAVSPEEDELITAEVFAEANVVDWEHIQPEDDGVELPFSIENAKKLLSDPDWVSLLSDWQIKSNTIANFQARRQAEVGN